MASDNGGPMLSPIYDKGQQNHLPPNNNQIPAVGEFLDSSKDRLDQDPEATPYDDLRHYAYEGDGNSGGSLSSLNSSKDEDLEFEYLHNFGPRFKKLADMYGRESDSDDSEEGVDNLGYYPSQPQPQQQQQQQQPGAASESWCWY